MRTVLIGLGMLLLAAGALPAAPEIMLYNGDAQERGGMRFDSWGSGYVGETTTAHYIGPQVLRLLTQGYYQAGVINYNQPVALKEYLGNPNAYLQLWLKPSVITAAAPASTTPPKTVTPAAPTRAQGPVGPRAMSRPGNPAAGGNQALPARPAATPAPAVSGLVGKANFLVSQLQVVLLTDKGEMIADSWPIEAANLSPGAWKRIDLPMAYFKSAQSEPASLLKGLRISGDRADVFYIGQMSLLVDDAPLRLQISGDPARPNIDQAITFRANVEGGAASTLVSWDFDNSDGIQVQAQGDTVQWIYRQSGSYIVTAIATDEFGGKTPVTVTTMVIVNIGPQ
jgi:hypothetical protein